MRKHAWDSYILDALIGIVIGIVLGTAILMIMNRGFYV